MVNARSSNRAVILRDNENIKGLSLVRKVNYEGLRVPLKAVHGPWFLLLHQHPVVQEGGAAGRASFHDDELPY